MLADALAPVLSPTARPTPIGRTTRKLGISFSKETLLKKANNVKQKVRLEGGWGGAGSAGALSLAYTVLL